MAHEEWSDNDDSAEISLQHKRPFGSGLRRKQVVFVPASSNGNVTADKTPPQEPSKSISDIYLSLVLPQDAKKDTTDDEDTTPGPDVCEICKLPLNFDPEAVGKEGFPARTHEASIAHQVCLPHSHPPSALDRSRMGLGVLRAQGWDPDARTGLGASRQGISFPIKPTPKYDTLGLGTKIPKDVAAKKKEKPQLLNAKKVRKMAAEDKGRQERLRRQFYGNEDVERYLGLG
ncbi:hypothetical protein F5Y17DRAFT_421834 [Xylariaceae sp. FL0594]|nr:hypothetical protein F5Y17DRAFT_421834 [Xylariaceae sp. FL0594]